MPTVRAALRAAYPNRLAVGRTLAQGLAVWARNLIPFFLIALLLNAPLLVIREVLRGQWLGDEPDYEAYRTFIWVQWILSFLVIQRLLNGTVTFAVVESLRGRRGRLGRCLVIAISRLPQLVVVATVVGATTLAPLLLLVFGVELDLSARSLLLLPTLILQVLFFVVDAAVMAERPRFLGLGALARSVRLTASNRLRITWLLVILWVLVWGLRHLVWVVTSALNQEPLVAFEVMHYAWTAVTLLSSTLLSVVHAVAYYELRRLKEGVDLDEIAKVFD